MAFTVRYLNPADRPSNPPTPPKPPGKGLTKQQWQRLGALALGIGVVVGAFLLRRPPERRPDLKALQAGMVPISAPRQAPMDRLPSLAPLARPEAAAVSAAARLEEDFGGEMGELLAAIKRKEAQTPAPVAKSRSASRKPVNRTVE